MISLLLLGGFIYDNLSIFVVLFVLAILLEIVNHFIVQKKNFVASEFKRLYFDQLEKTIPFQSFHFPEVVHGKFALSFCDAFGF